MFWQSFLFYFSRRDRYAQVNGSKFSSVMKPIQITSKLPYQRTRKEVREQDPGCRPTSTDHITLGTCNNNFQKWFNFDSPVFL